MERDHVPTRKPHFGMIMPASIEDLYNGLTPKVRKNLKRQWRKLLEDYNGAVLVREFRNADEVDELAATVESIARTNYQRGLGVGFRDCPEERQRLRLSATKGWLRANVLYLNEKPCAFWIGALNNGVFLSDYLGFDPAYAKHSPGMSLIMNVLESFLNGSDTVTEIDFATGDAQYKEVLSNYQFDETAAYLFSRSAAGAKLNTLRTVTAKTDQTAKTILSTIGLQEKIKKFWRHRAQLKNAS